jgi:hypothetical protein
MRLIRSSGSATALGACGFAIGFAVVGACLPRAADLPPLASGRYVLTPAAGSIPSLPITFADSAGHTQRIFGDTIELNVTNATYTEHGTVALLNGDGTAQPSQSFVIGPKAAGRIDDHTFDLPSTIVGAARLFDLFTQPTRQIQLSRAGVAWVYSLR